MGVDNDEKNNAEPDACLSALVSLVTREKRVNAFRKRRGGRQNGGKVGSSPIVRGREGETALRAEGVHGHAVEN